MSTRPVFLLLRNGSFLRLLSVRLTGSFGDGLLQAALASFVLFSPERQPTPIAIAVSFGILLLPYSLVSPFAGVFLDRWRRRQVLVRANWLRALTVLVAAGAVALQRDGLDLGVIVLITLAIGRFVLAGLSASLPHVVPRDQLVTANSIAPTTGTIVYGAGILLGIVLRGVLGGGDFGAALVLVAACGVYLGAGAVGLSLGRDQLGPGSIKPAVPSDNGEARSGPAVEGGPAEPSPEATPSGPTTEPDTVGAVLRGMIDGFRVLLADGPSWRAVFVVLIYRIGFGAMTVLLLLILRNALHPASDPDAALRDFSLIAGAVTLGALAAAFATPPATRRIGTIWWTTTTLLLAGLAVPVGISPITVVSMSVAGFIVGLAQQAAKIGADTTLQRRISGNHLGRVFSLFDVAVNIGLVVGALILAFTAPDDGIWPIGYWILGALYLLTALWYWWQSRHDLERAAAASAPAEPQ
ncbi:MAG: MFS transporter [Actinomycetia bacterium]|nr:MFS transporter [Actinomycetes bacterium]